MATARDPAATTRPLRADARRNRDAVLRAARETFENHGVFASLDAIALRAGVGNATLYRHFSTRDDLLAAVLQSSIEAALTDADERASSFGPREALLEWIQALTWQLRIWHDLPACVAASRGDLDSPMAGAMDPLVTRTGLLLDAAKASGDAVDAVTTDEVFELGTAMSWAVDHFGDDELGARRRVDLATAGIFT